MEGPFHPRQREVRLPHPPGHPRPKRGTGATPLEGLTRLAWLGSVLPVRGREELQDPVPRVGQPLQGQDRMSGMPGDQVATRGPIREGRRQGHHRTGAHAHRAMCSILQGSEAERNRSAHRRSTLEGDPQPPEFLGGRWSGLPDVGTPEQYPERRRDPAHRLGHFTW